MFVLHVLCICQHLLFCSCILEASYELHDVVFFQNLGTVLLYAVIVSPLYSGFKSPLHTFYVDNCFYLTWMSAFSSFRPRNDLLCVGWTLFPTPLKLCIWRYINSIIIIISSSSSSSGSSSKKVKGITLILHNKRQLQLHRRCTSQTERACSL